MASCPVRLYGFHRRDTPNSDPRVSPLKFEQAECSRAPRYTVQHTHRRAQRSWQLTASLLSGKGRRGVRRGGRRGVWRRSLVERPRRLRLARVARRHAKEGPDKQAALAAPHVQLAPRLGEGKGGHVGQLREGRAWYHTSGVSSPVRVQLRGWCGGAPAASLATHSPVRRLDTLIVPPARRSVFGLSPR